jgi:hypothetical protein
MKTCRRIGRRCDLDALIHDVIAKPFTLADIRSAVASALAAGTPGKS